MSRPKTASGLSASALGRGSPAAATTDDSVLALYARPDVQASAIGLELPPDLGFEEWQGVGQTIRRAAKAALWWWGDWCNYGERAYGETYAQALETSDYSYQGLRDAAWVADRIGLSRRRDNLSWSHHREVAALEPSDQDDYLDKAEAEGWTREELRRAVRRRALAPALEVPALPPGTFDVLLADPPWAYDFAETDSRSIEAHYPSLSVEEICDYAVDGRKVGDLAHDDAVLFLWATAPKLREGLAVMEAWGFDYRTHMIWLKDKIGMGYYARSKHELLLIGRRGDPGVPEEGARPDSVFEGPRLDHSRKPDIAYDLVETMYPDRTYLELFARRERDGWTSWGTVG